jgi:hypothetical protein
VVVVRRGRSCPRPAYGILGDKDMKTATAAAAAVGFGVLIGPVIAGRALLDVCTWDNTSGGNWSEMANWNPQEVPDTSSEAATVPNDGFEYTIELDMDPQIAWLSIDNPTATLNLNQQYLVLNDAGASVNHGIIAANANGGLIVGDLANASDGEIRVVSGGALYFDDDDDPTDGVVLDNDGTIIVNAEAGDADTLLGFDADVTLTGNGDILLNRGGTWSKILTASGVSITHDDDHMIHGKGNINASMTNRGTILSDDSSTIAIFPGVLTGEPGEVTFVNDPGLIRSVNGNVAISYADNFRNDGTVQADSGTRVDIFDGNYLQTTGITRVNGTMEVGEGFFDLQGGSIRGSGQINTDIEMSGGVIFPGEIFNAGVLTLEGSLNITGSAIFIDLESESEFDQINASGDVVVAGWLYIYAIEQYIPPEGQEFVIITGNTVSGEFDTVWASGQYDIIYNPQDVTIRVVTPPRPTDINGDGVVNIQDFLELLSHWGPCPAPCPPCYADINNDCTVDVVDFLALLANWDPVPG